jgi:hypothetical protein
MVNFNPDGVIVVLAAAELPRRLLPFCAKEGVERSVRAIRVSARVFIEPVGLLSLLSHRMIIA